MPGYYKCVSQYRQSKRNTYSAGHLKYSFYKKASTNCLISGLKLCLYNNDLVFENENLLHTNETETDALNSCLYADIAVASFDQVIMEQKETTFQELLYFG